MILIDLGCEKTNLSQVEKYLLNREKSFDKPVAKIGIQEVGGTQAAILGRRVFDYVIDVASGVQAKAEIHKHREFQFWAEQTVSL